MSDTQNMAVSPHACTYMPVRLKGDSDSLMRSLLIASRLGQTCFHCLTFQVYTDPHFSDPCSPDQYSLKKPVPWKCMHTRRFSNKNMKAEVLHHTLVDIKPVILRFPALFCYSVICFRNSTHWGYCVTAKLNESLPGDTQKGCESLCWLSLSELTVSLH